MIRVFNFSVLVAISLALGACSGFNYKDYQGQIDPAVIKPYDLSGRTPGAPIIYFDTTTYRDLGVPFHRLLLATHVDDQHLAGAGRGEFYDFSGYQAVKVTPGKHSLQWCWVSKNSLGTGGGTCSFRAGDVEFKAGQRYLVTWNTSGMTRGHNSYIVIHSKIQNFDTQEVIFSGDSQSEGQGN
ncbi:hypothetical protein [Pseudomonas sp.]|uniref:hypothetical protein n=1 Tax=Pseudomonas sp. TaxID=306 RepID=UPI003C78EC06